jgi:hypothetical protein
VTRKSVRSNARKKDFLSEHVAASLTNAFAMRLFHRQISSGKPVLGWNKQSTSTTKPWWALAAACVVERRDKPMLTNPSQERDQLQSQLSGYVIWVHHSMNALASSMQLRIVIKRLEDLKKRAARRAPLS